MGRGCACYHQQTVNGRVCSLAVMQWLLLLLLIASMHVTSASFLWNYALFPPPDVDYSIEELCKRTGQSAADLHTNANFTRKYCQEDSECGAERFCDEHYAACWPRRRSGQPCRSEHQCRHRHECIFGRCRKKLRPPQAGARCRRSSECGREQCCCRHHGEMVCKPRRQLGELCYVPRGGLSYSLNEICPCVHGLVCSLMPSNRTTSSQSMVCAPVQQSTVPSRQRPSDSTVNSTATPTPRVHLEHTRKTDLDLADSLMSH